MLNKFKLSSFPSLKNFDPKKFLKPQLIFIPLIVVIITGILIVSPLKQPQLLTRDVKGVSDQMIPTAAVLPTPTIVPTAVPAKTETLKIISTVVPTVIKSAGTTSSNTSSNNSSNNNSSNITSAPTATPFPNQNPTFTPSPAVAPTSVSAQNQVNMTINDPDGSPSFQVKLNSDADACAVLQEAKDEGKIKSVTFDDSYMSSMHSKYILEINGFQNNWTFTVNGASPLGCSLSKPQPNDNIVWKFN